MLNEYLKSINKTKEDVMVDDYAEKQYKPYIINRCLSNFPDTLFQANEMNRYHDVLDYRLQFDYLRGSIRPQNRFTPWKEKEKDELVELAMEFFNYSRIKAEQIVPLLSKSKIEYIRMSLDKGGFDKVKKPKGKGKK